MLYLLSHALPELIVAQAGQGRAFGPRLCSNAFKGQLLGRDCWLPRQYHPQLPLHYSQLTAGTGIAAGADETKEGAEL